MKKLLCFAVILVLFTAAAGCRPADETPPQAQQPDITEPQAPVPADDEPAGLPIRPLKAEKDIDLDSANIIHWSFTIPLTGVESIDNYYRNWLRERQDYANYAEENSLDIKLSPEYADTPAYSIESGYSIMRNDMQVLSILRDWFEYMGGAHPGTTIMAENFTPEGSSITLDDVFTVGRDVYLPRIMSIVEAQIEESPNKDIYFPNYSQEMVNTFKAENFYLGEDTLSVFWQTYDIAPYVAGVQRFDIDFSEIEDIINPRWIKS